MEINWNKVKKVFVNDNTSKDINLSNASLNLTITNAICKYYPGQNNDFNNYRIAKSIREMKEKYKETVGVDDFFSAFQVFYSAISNKEYIQFLKN